MRIIQFVLSTIFFLLIMSFSGLCDLSLALPSPSQPGTGLIPTIPLKEISSDENSIIDVPVNRSTGLTVSVPVNYETRRNMGNQASTLVQSLTDQCTPYGVTSDPSLNSVTSVPPLITSLIPSSVFAGSGAFTLTVDGNYFIPESRILWDAKDRTDQYLSPYQITARILADDIELPGQHYIIINNPEPCGGNSNVGTFTVRDSGQTFPLYADPLNAHIIKTETQQINIQFSSLPKGLLSYNLTLMLDNQSLCSFFFSGFPSWVSEPYVSWSDNTLNIRGTDGRDLIQSNATNCSLVTLSVIGNQTGSGSIQCLLNNAIADNGNRYGKAYTAVPITVREVQSFKDSSGRGYPSPTDINADGLYEDINGNSRIDFSDVVIYASSSEFIQQHQPWWVFDYDLNGFINLNDVVLLFQMTLH